MLSSIDSKVAAGDQSYTLQDYLYPSTQMDVQPLPNKEETKVEKPKIPNAPPLIMSLLGSVTSLFRGTKPTQSNLVRLHLSPSCFSNESSSL